MRRKFFLKFYNFRCNADIPGLHSYGGQAVCTTTDKNVCRTVNIAFAFFVGSLFWACPEYDTFGDNDVSPNIFRVNVDGTGEDQITDSNYGYKSSPYFADGGNKIVYWGIDENYHWTVFVMDANGDNEQKITRD